MSQIFDALHQSQGERPSHSSRKFANAKELLQTVEQNVERHGDGEGAAGQLVPREHLQQFPATKISLPANSKLVCFSHTDSLAAEKFRFLATRLRHLQQKRALKRLVITSSVPAEGKTMVAANLACALAGGKQHVLLVEGDFRRPSLAKQFGMAEAPGLSQLLEGKSDDSSNILHLESQGFCLLPAGSLHTSSMELMEAGRLAACMNSATEGFDWVIIDAPPVLPLADTTIWMRLADAILLVTRPGVTTNSQLQRTLEAIEQSKLLGAVLNASAEATASNYYYHYAKNLATIPIESSAAK
jgi:capsular exopolysaccharide synthesis family protein